MTETKTRHTNVNDALMILTRLRGMFGAVQYLMGGRNHGLDPDYENFELWFMEINDRMESCIKLLENN